MEICHYNEINEYANVYYIKEKLSNNQTLEFGFQLRDVKNNTNYWGIYICLYSKRKHKGINEDNIISTGKGNPFETLSLIREALPKIEQKIHEENQNRKNVFFVCWIDNRRRDVYYRFLKRYGYYFGVINNKKVLMK